MDNTSFLQSFQTNIPVPVKNFLIRATLIFIAWKILYLLVLLPQHIPDKQLTNLTAKTTSFFFNTLHNSKSTFNETMNNGEHITFFLVNGYKAIGIADRCNALELIILYTGFLFSIPLGWKKQVAYMTAGVAGIFILNILRCYALALLNLRHSSITDFAHHYLFTMIMYSLIFITWISYSKSYFKNEG